MHTDPELLGLLALGEQEGTEDDRAHLQSCPECAAELAELRRLVDLGRSVRTEPALVAPRPEVWARIRHELALDLTPEPLADRSDLAPVPTAAGASGHELTAHARLAPVAASWSSASGTAELATDERGRRVLEVALHADLPTSGVRQAWLLHRDDPSLRQTLGILDGPHGLWTVAHSIDLEKYSILDISQQDPGETEHSGQTIVRGELALVS
jgi:hypothetical protein